MGQFESNPLWIIDGTWHTDDMTKRPHPPRKPIPLAKLILDENAHPYLRFENTLLWKAVNKAIDDLVENKDLKETARREYIVGYICKILSARKGRLFSN
jgi:hypothetical protein